MAVADACVPRPSTDAHYVTRTPGGSGAVREVIELILRCQGHWQRTAGAFPRGDADPISQSGQSNLTPTTKQSMWTPKRILLLVLGMVVFTTAYGIYTTSSAAWTVCRELPAELVDRAAR